MVNNLSDLLGVDVGKMTVEECGFCKKKFENAEPVNYCSNCGADLKADITTITPSDIIELMLLKFGSPPRSLALIPHMGEIADPQADGVILGYVLGEGVGLAGTIKAPSMYPWKSITQEIKNYTTLLGIDATPSFFAVAHKEK